MTQPSHPNAFEKEGPAHPCTLHGQDLKWKNCTCISCGRGISKSTINRDNPSGCEIRDETGDYVGGTNLVQMQAVASQHGVKTELHVGGNVASLWYLAYQASLGRGFQLDGNEIVTKGKNVNHDVWVNNAIGGTPGDPDGFLVYDPDSDGPAVWSYAKTKAFAQALHPYGEADPRTLKSMGINGCYALLYPDTEPHFHSHFGGHQSSPFPDRTRAIKAGVLVHSTPHHTSKAHPNIVGKLAKGQLFVGYQYATGDTYRGSSKWVGNHDGGQWIHVSQLTHVGGGT